MCICFCWQPILWWRCTFWGSQRLSDIMFLPVWYWSYRKRYSIRKGKCICLSCFHFSESIHPSRPFWISKLFVNLSCIILWFVYQTPFLVQSDPKQWYRLIVWEGGRRGGIKQILLYVLAWYWHSRQVNYVVCILIWTKSIIMCWTSKWSPQTCQPLVKENLETREKMWRFSKK